MKFARVRKNVDCNRHRTSPPSARPIGILPFATWPEAQITNPFVFILDNADDLFESGLPDIKEEVIDLIGEILNRSDKVTFLLTTRESCQFLNLRFKGHHALRIRELDEQSSLNLAQELLPEASKSDSIKVRQTCAKVRFFELHISLFETLTEKFLTGHSMSAFLEYFQNEESFVQSLIDGCLEERTVSKACKVLIKAEIYLCFLYWQDYVMIDIIYETAIKAANDHNWLNSVHKRLLLSKTYGSLVMGATEETKRLLSVNKQDTQLQGEFLTYQGLYKMFIGRVEEGVRHLEEALSLMETTPKHRTLKLIILQVLALYQSSKRNPVKVT